MPPWALAVSAMMSVRSGSALSVALISTVGPVGTAWLRLSIGALIFLAVARPPLRPVRRSDVPALLGLGCRQLTALCWATYILLTRRVGDRFAGIGALSRTIPVAAITAAVVGIPQAAGLLGVEVAAAAGLALLLPVLPHWRCSHFAG